MLALGYAGWGPGQLESEILRNGWLTCDANEELVFSNESATLWDRALKTLGVNAIGLASVAGRA